MAQRITPFMKLFKPVIESHTHSPEDEAMMEGIAEGRIRDMKDQLRMI